MEALKYAAFVAQSYEDTCRAWERAFESIVDVSHGGIECQQFDWNYFWKNEIEPANARMRACGLVQEEESVFPFFHILYSFTYKLCTRHALLNENSWTEDEWPEIRSVMATLRYMSRHTKAASTFRPMVEKVSAFIHRLKEELEPFGDLPQEETFEVLYRLLDRVELYDVLICFEQNPRARGLTRYRIELSALQTTVDSISLCFLEEAQSLWSSIERDADKMRSSRRFDTEECLKELKQHFDAIVELFQDTAAASTSKDISLLQSLRDRAQELVSACQQSSFATRYMTFEQCELFVKAKFPIQHSHVFGLNGSDSAFFVHLSPTQTREEMIETVNRDASDVFVYNRIHQICDMCLTHPLYTIASSFEALIEVYKVEEATREVLQFTDSPKKQRQKKLKAPPQAQEDSPVSVLTREEIRPKTLGERVERLIATLGYHPMNASFMSHLCDLRASLRMADSNLIAVAASVYYTVEQSRVFHRQGPIEGHAEIFGKQEPWRRFNAWIRYPETSLRRMRLLKEKSPLVALFLQATKDKSKSKEAIDSLVIAALEEFSSVVINEEARSQNAPTLPSRKCKRSFRIEGDLSLQKQVVELNDFVRAMNGSYPSVDLPMYMRRVLEGTYLIALRVLKKKNPELETKALHELYEGPYKEELREHFDFANSTIRYTFKYEEEKSTVHRLMREAERLREDPYRGENDLRMRVMTVVSFIFERILI